MITATLRRTKTGDTGTFGILQVLGQEFLTGELPWRDNASFLSCIPAGRYLCKWGPSNRFGFAYEITGVQDRTRCLFHIANFFGDKTKGFAADVDGCCGLGRSPGYFAKKGYVRAQDALSGSGSAIDAFHKLLNQQDFELDIINEYLEAGAPPATTA